MKRYGCELRVIRYKHFVENKSITHITADLSAREIEKLHGNRLRSRMRK